MEDFETWRKQLRQATCPIPCAPPVRPRQAYLRDVDIMRRIAAEQQRFAGRTQARQLAFYNVVGARAAELNMTKDRSWWQRLLRRWGV